MVTRWRIFVWLFAVTEVTRSLQIHEWIWDRDPLGALMLIAGLALAFRPDSASLFLATVGVRLALFASRMPDVHNQEMIEAQMLLGVVAVWCLARPGNDEQRFAAVAPVIRVGLVSVYAIAVFQKLNTDFFDQEVGCAAVLWRASVDRWGLPTAWASLGWVATAGTLVIESGLPLLLILRRTRSVGLLLAMGFHWWLAADMGVYAFSAMMFAWLAAFVPATWLNSWNPVRSMPAALASVTVSTGAIAAIGVWFTAGARLGVLGWVWWLLLAIVLMSIAAVAAWKSRGPVPEPAFARGVLRGPAVVASVSLVIIASSPYLGLKTMTALSMYSNLGTEGGRWNHLVVPPGVKVFGFQDDLLILTGSNNVKLDAAARTGRLLPRFEVRRQLRLQSGPVWAEYVDGERTFRVQRDGETLVDPQGLLDGGSLVLDKLLHFNFVDAGSRQGCRFDRPMAEPRGPAR